MQFNFHHLRLFRAVAQSGSISRAAQTLHISQPSVSAQLRDFEQRCGVELLIRGPRGVTLTPVGRKIFDYAERIFSLADDLGTALRDLRPVRGEKLTIGGSLTAGEYFLPMVMIRFKECHPSVEPELVLDNSTVIVEHISGRKLDLGFVGTDAFDGDLLALPCWQDEIVIIAPPGSLSEDVFPTLPILQSQVFVLREQGSATRQWTERYLQGHGLTMKASMTVGSSEAVKRYVAAGLGWGFASKRSVDHEVRAGQLTIVRVEDWDCRRTFYAVHRKDHRLSPAQQAFLKFAQRLDCELAASTLDPASTV